LSDWFDNNGKKATCPPDADKDFLDTHEFLWDRDILEKFLDAQSNVYLFGMSGNVFDMLDLFDKIFFLKVPPETLAQRLRHESRENPMGKTDYQLQNALAWGKEIEGKAASLGIPMVDAQKTPEEIFKEINRN
jgi:hypothetical protein